jgi:dihydrofolate reductase
MGRIVAVENVSLDGVMQAPGRADEDGRGGFTRGGWALPYNDAVKGQVMGKGMAAGSALLFGRRTYEDFYKVWPKRTDNPFTAVLDRARKYVASRTLTDPLPWMNSTLLDGDAGAAVARLKAQSEQDIVVLGSGALVRSLMADRLIDELLLLIHPIVLGEGQRLFPDRGDFSAFALAESVPTTKGVVIATYRLEV